MLCLGYFEVSSELYTLFYFTDFEQLTFLSFDLSFPNGKMKIKWLVSLGGPPEGSLVEGL